MSESRVSLFLAALLVTALAGCNWKRDKVSTPLSAEATFSSINTYILQPKCLSCHNGPASAKGVDLSSYESLMAGGLIEPNNASQSRLYRSVANGSMPKGADRLTDQELGMIETWITAGATKGVVDPTPPDPAPSPTFAWISTYLFAKQCTGCHNGSHPKTDLDLRSYGSLMAFSGLIFNAVEPGDAEMSGLYLSLNNGTMPPRPEGVPSPISAETIQAVFDWIQNGAKQE